MKTTDIHLLWKFPLLHDHYWWFWVLQQCIIRLALIFNMPYFLASNGWVRSFIFSSRDGKAKNFIASSSESTSKCLYGTCRLLYSFSEWTGGNNVNAKNKCSKEIRLITVCWTCCWYLIIWKQKDTRILYVIVSSFLIDDMSYTKWNRI